MDPCTLRSTIGATKAIGKDMVDGDELVMMMAAIAIVLMIKGGCGCDLWKELKRTCGADDKRRHEEW